MLLYLDNCCFNRPYDEQSHYRIYLETQAKLYVQEHILNKQHDLIGSYILQFENDQNPHIAQQLEIAKWKAFAKTLVSASDDIVANAKICQSFGLHAKDALHCACAVDAKADFFLTTDKQLIKKAAAIKELNVINPLRFIEIEEDMQR
ncbi:MAG: PIN domain protein [Methylococcales bacterium]